MNILFIGPYRQNDGWGYAAKDYVRALQTTGCNLAIRPIYMSSVFGRTTLEDDLIEYEYNTFPYYDLIIQNVFPALLTKVEYNSVSLAYYETNHWKQEWADNLKVVDNNFVCSQFDSMILAQHEINNRVIPMPCDFTKFENVEPLNITYPKPDFLFYYIGELNTRKGLEQLLIAYHREFHRHEDVGLLIKTNQIGVSPEKVADKVQDKCNSVKEKMRLYGDVETYKNEIIITDNLSHHQMMQLHKLCDCFVLPSSGESFSRPAFDALCMGKTPIVNKNSGMNDFVNNQNGYLVDSYETPVYVDDPPYEEMYTSRETWFAPCILSLQKQMRLAYNCRKKPKIVDITQLRNIYSYESVGRKIIDYVVSN